MSLTLPEKIELVAARYDPEDICEALEITSEQLLAAFPQELSDCWYKFDEIEEDIEDLGGFAYD